MAFMAVNQLELDPLETATTVARSERYVGTHGGGMDQAVSILGRRDHALFIEFDPMRVRAIKMPANAALVVADTREIADKSGTVRAEYNRRVVECSLAARILGRVLKLDGVKILGDVVRGCPNGTRRTSWRNSRHYLHGSARTCKRRRASWAFRDLSSSLSYLGMARLESHWIQTARWKF